MIPIFSFHNRRSMPRILLRSFLEVMAFHGGRPMEPELMKGIGFGTGVGIGVGAGVGIAMQQTIWGSHPTPTLLLSNMTGEPSLENTTTTFLPVVAPDLPSISPKSTIRRPAWYLGPPARLDPVDTTIKSPAVGYAIAHPACFDIDAPLPPPSPPPILSPSPLPFRPTDEFRDFTIRHTTAISTVVAPVLYYLLDTVTPTSSAARGHLVYLQPLMAVGDFHYVWLVIVAILLSLELQNVACLAKIILGIIFECAIVFIKAFVFNARGSRMPMVIALEKLLVVLFDRAAKEEVLEGLPALVDVSADEEAELCSNVTSVPASLTPSPTPSSSPFSEDVSKALASLPSVASPAPATIPYPPSPSGSLDGDDSNEPRRRRLELRLLELRSSKKGGLVGLGVDEAVLGSGTVLPPEVAPVLSLEKIRSRSTGSWDRIERLRAAKGNVKPAEDSWGGVSRNKRVSRLQSGEERAYPSPKETPPVLGAFGRKSERYQGVRMRVDGTGDEIHSTSKPSVTRGRRSSLKQVRLPSPVVDYDPNMYEMIVHSMSPDPESYCPPHLRDDCEETWNPQHIPDLPSLGPIDDSGDPIPDNLMDL